jgi:hypothetical protein
MNKEVYTSLYDIGLPRLVLAGRSLWFIPLCIVYRLIGGKAVIIDVFYGFYYGSLCLVAFYVAMAVTRKLWLILILQAPIFLIGTVALILRGADNARFNLRRDGEWVFMNGEVTQHGMMLQLASLLPYVPLFCGFTVLLFWCADRSRTRKRMRT